MLYGKYCVSVETHVQLRNSERKKLTISKPPPLLCLGIKRTDRDDTIINAAPITHPRLIKIGGFSYNLYAVVLHRQATEDASVDLYLTISNVFRCKAKAVSIGSGQPSLPPGSNCSCNAQSALLDLSPV